MQSNQEQGFTGTLIDTNGEEYELGEEIEQSDHHTLCFVKRTSDQQKFYAYLSFLSGRPQVLKQRVIQTNRHIRLLFVTKDLPTVNVITKVKESTVIDNYNDGFPRKVFAIITDGVEGYTPLTTILENNGSLPPLTALRIINSLIQMLAVCHEAGFILRYSLSLENILINNNLNAPPKKIILLYNLTKVFHPNYKNKGQSSSLTQEVLLNTRENDAYMTPEEIESRKGIHAPTEQPMNDFWRLGVMIYYLITSKAPFGGIHYLQRTFREAGDIREKILNKRDFHDVQDTLSQLNDEVADFIYQSVNILLTKDGKERQQTTTTATLARAFARIMEIAEDPGQRKEYRPPVTEQIGSPQRDTLRQQAQEVVVPRNPPKRSYVGNTPLPQPQITQAQPPPQNNPAPTIKQVQKVKPPKHHATSSQPLLSPALQPQEEKILNLGAPVRHSTPPLATPNQEPAIEQPRQQPKTLLPHEENRDFDELSRQWLDSDPIETLIEQPPQEQPSYAPPSNESHIKPSSLRTTGQKMVIGLLTLVASFVISYAVVIVFKKESNWDNRENQRQHSLKGLSPIPNNKTTAKELNLSERVGWNYKCIGCKDAAVKTNPFIVGYIKNSKVIFLRKNQKEVCTYKMKEIFKHHRRRYRYYNLTAEQLTAYGNQFILIVKATHRKRRRRFFFIPIKVNNKRCRIKSVQRINFRKQIKNINNIFCDKSKTLLQGTTFGNTQHTMRCKKQPSRKYPSQECRQPVRKKWNLITLGEFQFEYSVKDNEIKLIDENYKINPRKDRISFSTDEVCIKRQPLVMFKKRKGKGKRKKLYFLLTLSRETFGTPPQLTIRLHSIVIKLKSVAVK